MFISIKWAITRKSEAISISRDFILFMGYELISYEVIIIRNIDPVFFG